MADKISIEIDLEGGKEVERQLADIGKAGEKSFSDIQDAADKVNLSGTSAQFDDLGDKGQAAFQKIQSAAQSTVALEQVVQGIQKVEGAFENLGTAVTRMATRMTKSLGLFGVLARSFGPVGIAAGVAAGAIVKFGNDAAKSLSQLTSEGAKLDLTAQQFDKLSKVLGQAGISTDALSGLEKFKESLAGDFFPTDLITAFQRFLAQLERMPDGVERTQLAMQKLGDVLGAQVIAGLQTGATGADIFASAMGRVTPATQEQILAANKYEQALKQLSQAWIELKTSMAPIVTPIFGFLTQELRNLKNDIAEIIAEFRLLKAVYNLFNAPPTSPGTSDELTARAKAVKDAWDQLGKTQKEVAQTSDETVRAVTAVGQAGEQTGQKITQGAATGSQAYNTLGQSVDSVGQKYDLLGQSVDSVGQKYNILGQQIQSTEGAAEKVASASAPTQTLALDVNNLAQAYARAAAAADAAANAARYLANLPRPTSIPSLESQRPSRFADGGLLGGRGTGTSDSNLAWVSRGEHIMPARAVAQPGMLALLEALRRSGGNLRGVLDGIGRFALGGLVPRSVPAFAGGGLAGGMSNVTIQFPGLPAIGGLRASSDVVDQLHRAAALAQVRSGGRKPSRYS